MPASAKITSNMVPVAAIIIRGKTTMLLLLAWDHPAIPELLGFNRERTIHIWGAIPAGPEPFCAPLRLAVTAVETTAVEAFDNRWQAF
jgi:hypothetical protein